MLAAQEDSMLLHEFSSHIRRNFTPEVWRSLFEEGAAAPQFGSATLSLLCVDVDIADETARAAVLSGLGRLVAASGGCVHAGSREYALASFRDAEAALHTGVALQRLFPKARLRVGLSTGRCRLARSTAQGKEFRVLLGSEGAHVESLTAAAAPGTLRLTPHDYDLLQDVIGRSLGSCLVIAELEEEKVNTVTLTLPPDQAAEMSTFAGLGLTV